MSEGTTLTNTSLDADQPEKRPGLMRIGHKWRQFHPEWRQTLFFYVVLPTMIASVSALRGSALSPELPVWRLAIMTVSLAIPTWIFAGLAKHFFIAATKQSALFETLGVALGGLFALIFNYYLLSAQLTFFGSFFYGFDAVISENGYGLADNLGTYLIGPSAFYFLFFWIAANVALEIYDRRQVTPRVGVGVPRAAEEVSGVPEFFKKLNLESSGNLIAIQAQQHYILVITRNGKEIVHYRFRDAVKELRRLGMGLQVHRSFWVAAHAVAEVVKTDRSYKLILVTGQEVPVSHRFRAAVEDFGIVSP